MEILTVNKNFIKIKNNHNPSNLPVIYLANYSTLPKNYWQIWSVMFLSNFITNCLISVTMNCGGTLAENCTYFDSSTTVVPGACKAKICKCNNNICQIRLDFRWERIQSNDLKKICRHGPSSSMMGYSPIAKKKSHWSNGEKYIGKINGIFSHKINLS